MSPDLSLVADGDRYLLNGRKYFATGAAVADVVIAGAVAEGGALDGELVVFAIDADRAGIHHHDDWDNVGYRARRAGRSSTAPWWSPTPTSSASIARRRSHRS